MINNINPPSHKTFTPTSLNTDYIAQQNEPYRYREDEYLNTARMDDDEENPATEQQTESITDATETTDQTATEAPFVTEGLLIRRLRGPSGPHIVRDSWCRVSESKDCVPAL